MSLLRQAALLLSVLAASPAPAGEAVVEAARATAADGGWRIEVTIRHDDTGWEHYADGWSVQARDGTELGYRLLAHPHETEQPFTRSLGGVQIPAGTREVFVRAHDKLHGWSAQRFEIRLPGN